MQETFLDVLSNYYRTPRPVLVLITAYGVAMGLYIKQPAEMFYHPVGWQAIGYRVNEPQTLEARRKQSEPS